jgi:hypothetical protein
MTRFPLLFCMATLGLAACAEPPSLEVSANKQAVQSAQQPAAAPYSPEYDPRAYVSTADLDTTTKRCRAPWGLSPTAFQPS